LFISACLAKWVAESNPPPGLWQKLGVPPSKPKGQRRWNGAAPHSLVRRNRSLEMNDHEKTDIPPAVRPAPPEQELEKELRDRPHDLDKKADVGSLRQGFRNDCGNETTAW
jgi:hypothetical protein